MEIEPFAASRVPKKKGKKKRRWNGVNHLIAKIPKYSTPLKNIHEQTYNHRQIVIEQGTRS
jgi:hypothetical protein